MAKTDKKQITVEMPKIRQVELTAVGSTPLMSCRKHEAAMEGIRASGPGQKAGKAKKTVLTPEEQFEAFKYKIDAKHDGFPASAIKGAMISAIRMLKESGRGDLSMKAAMPMFHVFPMGHHELMELRFSRCERSDDWPRLKGQTPVPVSRPVYYDWEADFIVQFDEDLISIDAIMAILMKAGQVGIGAWRPECKGNKGLFTVKERSKKGKRGKSAA